MSASLAAVVAADVRSAAAASQVTAGPARFTVITPECVRIEYASRNGFVDAPTLFAADRDARADARITRDGPAVTIDTGRLFGRIDFDGGASVQHPMGKAGPRIRCGTLSVVTRDDLPTRF